MPFIINAFVGSNISASVVANVGWRWGYGMFAILIPASLAPLIVTLVWAERKAKKLALAPKRVTRSPIKIIEVRLHNDSSNRLVRLLRLKFTQELDIVGLLLIGASVALILLPLTLAPKAKSGWKNPSMIAMIVVGFVIIPFIAIWEARFAKFPVIPPRFLKNRAVVGASLIGFFDFVSPDLLCARRRSLENSLRLCCSLDLEQNLTISSM
jgi:MFS family permease